MIRWSKTRLIFRLCTPLFIFIFFLWLKGILFFLLFYRRILKTFDGEAKKFIENFVEFLNDEVVIIAVLMLIEYFE